MFDLYIGFDFVFECYICIVVVGEFVIYDVGRVMYIVVFLLIGYCGCGDIGISVRKVGKVYWAIIKGGGIFGIGVGFWFNDGCRYIVIFVFY